MENSGGEDCIGKSRKSVGLILGDLSSACIHRTRSVDELLDRDVAVPALTVEMSALGRRVFHAVCRDPVSKRRDHQEGGRALEGVVVGFALIVDDNIVPTVGLIHIDLPLV
jgi:hypothetical protein